MWHLWSNISVQRQHVQYSRRVSWRSRITTSTETVFHQTSELCCSVFIFGKRKKAWKLCFSLTAEQNIFFTEEVTVQESAKNSATCALCVCCVCVCVIFFDCINTSQSNMTYQLFHRVLLLLHSSHKRRGLLLCGTHILLLVVIIQDAQWRLKGRKDN